jgi:hypothetical protein
LKFAIIINKKFTPNIKLLKIKSIILLLKAKEKKNYFILYYRYFTYLQFASAKSIFTFNFLFLSSVLIKKFFITPGSNIKQCEEPPN